MGVFILGGGNGNGKSDVDGNIMEWVGYPFAMATATASYLIALHFLPLPLLQTPPNVNSHDGK